MISLQVLLLLALGITYAAAWDPDCSTCVYHNNIGFVKGEFCQLYYMCTKNPYGDAADQDPYRWDAFCCAEGLAWDEKHLTCKEDPDCNDPADKCPNITTTTNTPCLYSANPNDKTKFFTSTDVEVMCPYGTFWNQTICTCDHDPDAAESGPCTQLLDFSFNNTYDSYSCYNFAKGDPYGEPSVEDGILCLNGENQFLQIGFLNNWFAWNPKALEFTVCMCVLPAEDGQTAGLLSMNCEMVDPQTGSVGSVVDIVLLGGVVQLYLGNELVNSFMVPPTDEWTRLCVTFNNGEFNAYWNNLNHFSGPRGSWPYDFAPNTHSATTLGYKNETFGAFKGYIDDFFFFNEAKDAQYFEDSYVARFP